jgi:capsular exopolysaccharide synthesis family protein
MQPKNSDSEKLVPLDQPSVELGQRVAQFSVVNEDSQVLYYLRFLRKHKHSILVTLVIVFTISVISTLRATRFYQAASKVAISPANQNILGLKNFEDIPDYDFDEELETETAILRSDALASQVISAMRLDRDSRFSGPKPTAPTSDEALSISDIENDSSKTAALLGAFRSGLTVQVIPGSRLIQVNYTHSDPRLAADIVNALVRVFIEENFKTKYESVTQTSDWLTKQLADLQLRMQTSEEKLVRYQRDHGIVGIDDKQNIVISKLDELNRELTAAESDRIQKEADYRLASEGDPSTFAKLKNDGSSLIDKLQEKTADLDTQLAQLTTQFGPGYPKVLELKNQLKQVQTEIAAEKTRMQTKLRDAYLAAAEQERLLRAEFEAQKKQANQLNESSIEYSLLKRDADSNRELYQDLLQKLKEAGVSAGLKSSNIRVVDVARTPTSPISPNVHRNLTLGFLIGLGLGIALAFVLENMDRTVRNLEELAGTSALPVLGLIPLQVTSSRYQRKRLTMISNNGVNPESPALVAYLRPKSEIAEAFRSLRTSILLSAFGAPANVIMVTSSLPQEGKTTISANTALVLAQAGSRVLLVDADLRRPGLAKMLGLKATGGLSTLVSGMERFEDVVVRFSKVPDLWILPAGPVPPQAAEMLGSARMAELIAGWRKEFDHIVIDTPPCLSVTDAAVLSPHVDRVLLVARAGQTQKPTFRRACSLLLQVNARGRGAVLNGFDTRAESYYYGGQYSGEYYEEISPYNGSLTSDNPTNRSIDTRVS